MMIDIKSMEFDELVSLQEQVKTELASREHTLFEEKCHAIIHAINDLCDAFPYASWNIDVDDDDFGCITVDLLRRYSVIDLVSCISR